MVRATIISLTYSFSPSDLIQSLALFGQIRKSKRVVLSRCTRFQFSSVVVGESTGLGKDEKKNHWNISQVSLCAHCCSIAR